LEVEKEMWDIWVELAGEELPLPLGGMAIRRSLPLNRALELEEILIDGVKVANAKKQELCTRLEEENLVRIGDAMLEKYLDMYASDASVELSELQLRALDRLYQIGFEKGLFAEPLKTEDYLLPRAYQELRL